LSRDAPWTILIVMKPEASRSKSVSVSLTRAVASHEITVLPAAAYDARFTAEKDTVGFAFDVQTGCHAIGSDRGEDFFRFPNSLALTPCGCDIRSSSSGGGEYLLISGPLVRASAETYVTNIQNPNALSAACHLRSWMLGGTLPDPMTAEAVISRMCEAALGRPPRREKAARWMTQARFCSITEAIDENLDGTLTVAGLAREVGLSASFLSRAFTAFCGQTPYDYVLSRRIKEARRLIAETDLPLAEIACCSGFSSQSHMTAIMKARIGVSPARINRHRLC
jgi:AraC family transcriptional regulator